MQTGVCRDMRFQTCTCACDHADVHSHVCVPSSHIRLRPGADDLSLQGPMAGALRRLIISALAVSAPLRTLGARNSPGDDEMFQEVLDLLAEELPANGPKWHMENAMEALSPTALQAMFEHFIPDATLTCGTAEQRAAHMRRRLQEEVLIAIPGAARPATETLLRLGGVETVGEMCRWLAVRVSKMPWMGMLRRKTAPELRLMLQEVGAQHFFYILHRDLIAKVLREASRQPRAGATDAGALRRLLDRELREGPQRAPAPRASTSLDECPKIVRKELLHAACDTQHSATRARGAPSSRGCIWAALAALPFRAMHAMYRRFVPEACRPCGKLAVVLRRMRSRLAREALAIMPPEAMLELPSLGHAEVVGALCHWLELRVLRMPWVRQLGNVSTRDLRGILEAASARPCEKTHRRLLLTKVLRPALADGAVSPCDRDLDVAKLRRVLDRVAPQSRRTVDPESIGYLEECPEIVRQAVVERRSDRESTSAGLVRAASEA